ncbi:Transcription antitermination factor NusB [Lactobacillus kimbladii]|uniref:Transcription antitermination factor NusB n=1 Tax=Lactobacillus kimbladii TaxID=1218506 RepID=A0A0F4LHD1_9LACO|nr:MULTISPECIES: transcription antitermination factor NusB [Lactobacillus]KJY57980.1 Transcription antitermination factor NusB [Lactobacillus kimbladii]MBC6369367.1 transcription antitermination factor NusB [Lactobacillus kullabergensis]MBI0121577.1 transcription antitermination factor NusB [Lactobacillus sp. M0398]MBI0122256.1 transcription antitermination factor NusB [Lactobacillus sp. W8174]MBI0134680.1 transcription antitermination factor NusB [Lactobacillus sp. W8173]
MNQHESRRVAMQAVYLSNQDLKYTANEVEAKTVAMLDLKVLSAYSKELIEGVIEKRDELKGELASYLKKNWRINRINQISLAILEVALYEIKYSKEIEPKAAVNEALNLCDEFADPKDKPFINGMLANFI